MGVCQANTGASLLRGAQNCCRVASKCRASGLTGPALQHSGGYGYSKMVSFDWWSKLLHLQALRLSLNAGSVNLRLRSSGGSEKMSSALEVCANLPLSRFEGSGRRPNRHHGTLAMRALLGQFARNVRWSKALSFLRQVGAQQGFASLAFCGGQPFAAGLE